MRQWLPYPSAWRLRPTASALLAGRSSSRSLCRPLWAASSARWCWASAAPSAKPWRWPCSSATPTSLVWSLFSPGNTLAALLANHFPEAGTVEVGALMYAALVLMLITLDGERARLVDHAAHDPRIEGTRLMAQLAANRTAPVRESADLSSLAQRAAHAGQCGAHRAGAGAQPIRDVAAVLGAVHAAR